VRPVASGVQQPATGKGEDNTLRRYRISCPDGKRKGGLRGGKVGSDDCFFANRDDGRGAAAGVDDIPSIACRRRGREGGGKIEGRGRGQNGVRWSVLARSPFLGGGKKKERGPPYLGHYLVEKRRIGKKGPGPPPGGKKNTPPRRPPRKKKKLARKNPPPPGAPHTKKKKRKKVRPPPTKKAPTTNPGHRDF